MLKVSSKLLLSSFSPDIIDLPSVSKTNVFTYSFTVFSKSYTSYFKNKQTNKNPELHWPLLVFVDTSLSSQSWNIGFSHGWDSIGLLFFSYAIEYYLSSTLTSAMTLRSIHLPVFSDLYLHFYVSKKTSWIHQVKQWTPTPLHFPGLTPNPHHVFQIFSLNISRSTHISPTLLPSYQVQDFIFY